MGRESTITFEQITAVADAMKMEGVKPTSRAVRERLGNTGSMGTINKLLGRWKSGQERQISAALVLPPALQRVLLEFMDNELTAARTTLEADLVAVRAVLETERTGRQQAEQSAAVLAAKLEAAERRATEAEARTTKAEAATAQAAAKAEAVASELVNVSAAAQVNQGRLESTLRELDAAKGAMATATAAAEKSGEAAAELREQLEALKAQVERGL